jgi:hypothetical protein
MFTCTLFNLLSILINLRVGVEQVSHENEERCMISLGVGIHMFNLLTSCLLLHSQGCLVEMVETEIQEDRVKTELRLIEFDNLCWHVS